MPVTSTDQFRAYIHLSTGNHCSYAKKAWGFPNIKGTLYRMLHSERISMFVIYIHIYIYKMLKDFILFVSTPDRNMGVFQNSDINYYLFPSYPIPGCPGFL